MKKMFAVLAALLLGLTADVKAYSPYYTGFPMGSTNAVENYCASQCYALYIMVYQNTVVGGQIAAFFSNVGTLDFTNKADFDAYFQSNLVATAHVAAANTNIWIDKSAPYWFYVEAAGYNSFIPGEINFMAINSTPFWLTKVGDTYMVPDNQLRQKKLLLLSQVPYIVPRLKWARMEISSSNSIVTVNDSLQSADPNFVNVPYSMLLLPTSVATADAVNGPYQVKISIVVSNAAYFKTYEQGVQVAEKSFCIENPRISGSPKAISFKVSGGEIGRTLLVQSSIKPTGPWTNVLGRFTITPGTTNGTSLSYTVPATNQFYRIMSTNMIPVY